MHTEQEEKSLLNNIVKVLYYPIPFLPESSVFPKARMQVRKRNALNNHRKNPGNERKLRGKIHLINKSRLEICEHTIEFNENSWVFGEIREGAVAEITIKEKAGIYQASRIVIIE